MFKAESFFFTCFYCGAGNNLLIGAFLDRLEASVYCKNCGVYYFTFKNARIPEKEPISNYFEKLKAEKFKGALFGDE